MKTTYRLEIEVLSPLHIGSGRAELKNDVDFVCSKGVHVIDIDRALESLSVEAWGKAVKGAPLSEVIPRGQYSSLAFYTLNDPTGGRGVQTIREQIKDCYHRPYIPGSSLKGAVRTALAWAMLKDGVIRLGKSMIGDSSRNAAKDIMKKLFGDDPYHDLLRAMHVFDTEPVSAGECMELSMVSIYSLARHAGKELLRPKGGGYRFPVETIRPGTNFTGEISFDNTLLAKEVAGRLRFQRNLPYLRDFLSYCNQFARHLVDQEQIFSTRYDLAKVSRFYRQLAETAANLPKGEGLLQISWGTGWTAKTVGTVFDQELMKFILQKFRLGRREAEVFPKTRRYVEKNGAPEIPLGWIKIRCREMFKV